MKHTSSPEVQQILQERFGKDTLLALATIDGEWPAVRTVNSWYDSGAFYIITHAKSRKVRQLAHNPRAAICGDWFTAHGMGENLGPLSASENAILRDTLRKVFAAWYDNGHIDEKDPNTCILRIRLTDGILFHHGTRYDLDFT